MRRFLLILLIPTLTAMTKFKPLRLTWTPPDTYEDGSPLVIHHYNLYQKIEGTDSYEAPFAIPASHIDWPTWGRLFQRRTWAISAVDEYGNESPKSNDLVVFY